MNSKSKRVVLLATMLALVAMLVLASVALAQGPGGRGSVADRTGGSRWDGGQSQGARQSDASAQSMGRRGGGNGGAVGTLSEAEVDALYTVLDDEYHAWAVYDQVIQDFGSVSPFAEIRDAEARHAAAVERQLEKYGLEIPDNLWTGAVPGFDSVAEACAAAAQAEIDNAGLYDQALAATDKANLVRVFTSLQSASLNSHLPAFEACATP